MARHHRTRDRQPHPGAALVEAINAGVDLLLVAYDGA